MPYGLLFYLQVGN